MKSLFTHLPVISVYESKFNVPKTRTWIQDRFHVAVLICLLYVTSIYVGRSWMANRKPYSLRRLLLAWNTGLAAFSILGAIVLVPPLVHNVYYHGFIHSYCRSTYFNDPHLALWTILFVFSKLIELGDTAFVVLRKSPLQFLHWYHHITVLLYCWYGTGVGSALGHWFGAMNVIVHSIMYSYYAVKVVGIRVPSGIAKIITTLQISQMFVGLTLILITLKISQDGVQCDVSHNAAYIGLAMYTSYFILFLNFFYHRYCSKTKTQ